MGIIINPMLLTHNTDNIEYPYKINHGEYWINGNGFHAMEHTANESVCDWFSTTSTYTKFDGISVNWDEYPIYDGWMVDKKTAIFAGSIDFAESVKSMNIFTNNSYVIGRNITEYVMNHTNQQMDNFPADLWDCPLNKDGINVHLYYATLLDDGYIPMFLCNNRNIINYGFLTIVGKLEEKYIEEDEYTEYNFVQTSTESKFTVINDGSIYNFYKEPWNMDNLTFIDYPDEIGSFVYGDNTEESISSFILSGVKLFTD